MTAMREAVREAGTDTAVKYTTIVGDFTFNADGDTSQKIVSIYSVDPAGANGKGDWKFETQVDYARSSRPVERREAGDPSIPGLVDTQTSRSGMLSNGSV